MQQETNAVAVLPTRFQAIGIRLPPAPKLRANDAADDAAHQCRGTDFRATAAAIAGVAVSPFCLGCLTFIGVTWADFAGIAFHAGNGFLCRLFDGQFKLNAFIKLPECFLGSSTPIAINCAGKTGNSF